MECRIVEKNGMKAIEIGGKVYPPVSFKSFRACARNISDFYGAGLRLFCILDCGIPSSLGIPYSLFGESWVGEEQYDFSVTDKQIDLFLENAPEGYFSLMLSLDTRKWWLAQNPGATDSFFELAKIEADPKWRTYAAKYLQAMLSHVEAKYGDRFFGYFMLCGGTTEWFSEKSLEESSPSSLAAYRRYMGDPFCEVPSKTRREGAENVVFLDKDEDRDLISYRRFEGWLRADTILYFAKKAQEVLGHKKLLGVYFGYIFELCAPRLWNTGYLDYERVITSPDLDMIANPISYDFRRQEDGSHGMVADTTLSLHQKLCFYEHDQTTCLVPDVIEGARFSHPHKAKSVKEDVNLLRRDFMLALSRGCATWWFDMFGGWFYDERLMAEIQNMIAITERALTLDHRSVSEVAVVADPESMYYVNKNCSLNEMLLRWQRAGLSEMGAPYDLYSACDIPQIDPDRYKLVIFLDAFRQTDACDALVKKLRESGKTVLFLYAHNLIGADGRFDHSQMERALGVPIEQNTCHEDTVLLRGGGSFATAWRRPCYAICPKEGLTVLGSYEKSGRAAFGYVCGENGSHIAFSGMGCLNGEALAPLLTLAGVHRYAQSAAAAVYLNTDLLGVYHRAEKDLTLYPVGEDGDWLDLFDGGIYAQTGGVLQIPYQNNRAKLLVKKEKWQ